MTTKQNAKLMIMAAALSAAVTANALAQGVGNLPALPTSFPINGNSWWVTDPAGGPLPVVRDPNGPAWIKKFYDPNGAIQPTPGQIFPVFEKLLIAPPLDWSDWHEQILTPGWDWGPVVYMFEGQWQQQPPAGLVVINTPGTPTQGGTLDFYFNPLPPGTQLDIRKYLVYTGPQGQTFPYIEIAQYPTPEPASMGLLAAGAALTLRRRRHGRTA